MADSDKDIIITPNRSQTVQPEMKFAFMTVVIIYMAKHLLWREQLNILFTIWLARLT